GYAKMDALICVLSDAPEKHQPLVPLADRRELLYALGVDNVYTDRSVAESIRLLRPAYFVKGNDWAGKLPQDIVDACQEYGTRIVYTDTVTQSSSKLLADYQRRVNAEKLAALETFVSQQKPASKPWEPVTDYSR